MASHDNWRKVNGKFRDHCKVILKMKPVEEKPEWKDFIGQCSGRFEISFNQWRFFKAVHKECTGNWPNWEDFDATPTAPPEDKSPDLGF